MLVLEIFIKSPRILIQSHLGHFRLPEKAFSSRCKAGTRKLAVAPPPDGAQLSAATALTARALRSPGPASAGGKPGGACPSLADLREGLKKQTKPKPTHVGVEGPPSPGSKRRPPLLPLGRAPPPASPGCAGHVGALLLGSFVFNRRQRPRADEATPRGNESRPLGGGSFTRAEAQRQ